MKTKELRIGNILDSDYGELSEVMKIEHKDYTLWNSGEIESIVCRKIGGKKDVFIIVDEDKWKPISLSVEWLLKFGFKKQDFMISNSDVYEHTSGIRVFHNRRSTFNISRTGFQSYVIKSDVKYVHQLQNMYFALIGEDLSYETTE